MRHCWSAALVLCCSLITSAVPDAKPDPPPAAPPPAAKEVLDAYERSLGRVRTWSMQLRLSRRVEWAKAEGPFRGGSSKSTCVYYRDGDRFDLTTTTTDSRDADGELWRGGESIGEASRSIVNGWWIGYYGHPGARPQAHFRADGKQYLWRALAQGGAEVMDGYLADEYSILAALRKAEAVAVRDQQVVDGASCVQLDGAVLGHGKWSAWFDPSVEHLPRKVVQTKSGGDEWCGARLGTNGKRYAPYGSVGETTMERVTYVVDSIKYRQVDGGFVPVSCQIYQEVRFSDGNVKRLWTTCARDRIDLRPDFAKAGAFVPELPEGHPLVNDDEGGSPYAWRQGRPVLRDGPGL
jgi:hypothetical protein